jgi:hypothetical protein
MNEKMEYIKQDKSVEKVVRTEILFTPLLVIFPLIVGIVLIYDWFTRGYLMGDSTFDGELMLGIILLIGNIMFDIPFIKSLRELSKNKRK